MDSSGSELKGRKQDVDMTSSDDPPAEEGEFYPGFKDVDAFMKVIAHVACSVKAAKLARMSSCEYNVDHCINSVQIFASIASHIL